MHTAQCFKITQKVHFIIVRAMEDFFYGFWWFSNIVINFCDFGKSRSSNECNISSFSQQLHRLS